MHSPLDEKRFGNSLGSQEGTHRQEVRCRSVAPVNLLERQREGSRHGKRMISVSITLFEETQMGDLEELQEVRQTALRLCDIGSRLVECERQAIHDRNDLSGC